MLQSTVTFKGDILKELEAAKEDVRDEIVTKFNDGMDQAVISSPVWSGAYVKSFSVLVNGVGPTRSRISKRENGPVSAGAAKGEAISQLNNDLAPAWNIDLEDLKSLTLVNRAPHARAVETGTPYQPSGYNIFSAFRDRMRTPLTTVRRGRGGR